MKKNKYSKRGKKTKKKTHVLSDGWISWKETDRIQEKLQKCEGKYLQNINEVNYSRWPWDKAVYK